jgi:hypothetical protein
VHICYLHACFRDVLRAIQFHEHLKAAQHRMSTNIRLFGSRTIVLHDTHLLCFSKHVAPDYIHHPMSLAVHGLHLHQARLYVCVAWPAPIYCTVSIPEHWQTLPINLSSFLSGGRDLASISSRCLCAVVVLLSLWLSCPRCDVT